MEININCSSYKMSFTTSQAFGIDYGSKTRLCTGNGTTIVEAERQTTKESSSCDDH